MEGEKKEEGWGPEERAAEEEPTGDEKPMREEKILSVQDGFSVKEERPVPQCQAGGEKRALDLVRRKAMGKLASTG